MTRPLWNGPWADEFHTGHPVIDCVVASCLNGENVESDGGAPVTDAEVDALRKASGDTSGGETLAAGDLALQRRYHRPPHPEVVTRAAIAAALEEGHWVVTIGMIGALPARLRTQSKSVMHAVLLGPGKIVDPLDRSFFGHPQARNISLTEQLAFVRSGGYDALVFIPHRFSVPSTGHVVKRRGHFFPYTRRANGSWSRPLIGRLTGGFSADTTVARTIPDVVGRTRQMVEVKTGFMRGKWLDIAQMSRYTEE